MSASLGCPESTCTLRTVTPGKTPHNRLPCVGYHRFFPEARAIEQRTLPTFDATRTSFVCGAFNEITLAWVTLDQVEPVTDWANRLRQRAISPFAHLTAEQTAAGFARLDAAVAANPGQVEVRENADLLVLRRRRSLDEDQ